eukprot:jgi/Astpho2/4083/Aster-01232
MAPHARTSFLDNTKAGPSGDASVPLLSNTDQPSAPALEQQYASAPPDADAGGTSSPLQQDAKPEGTAYSLPSNYQPHYASVPPGAAEPAQPALGIPAPQQPHEVIQPGYTLLASHSLGPDPIIVQCPYCGSETLTRVDHVSSCCTWFSALALCLLGCPVFFWIPFCVPTGKDTVHRCGHCNTCLGRHNFGGL